MTSPARLPLLLVPVLALLALGGAQAQPRQAFDDADQARTALEAARKQGDEARARAEKLEADAARAGAEADRTARETAAVAARIQQSEAGIAADEARAALVARQQGELRARLAARQAPLVQLTAALQRLARRPTMLSLLHPGSVRETMYMRALLESTVPEVRKRTAALRGEIARARKLEAEARQAAQSLRAGKTELERRRKVLSALEARQRLASRQAGGIADREADRALALAEQARDLGTLLGELDRASDLREKLAALPGPVIRPDRPEDARVADEPERTAAASSGPGSYVLPAAGRLVAGFGEARTGSPTSRGIAIATRAGAQAVSPAAGRVAFAGLYRGYGKIVIIEHGGGWTSLITGLADLDAKVGQNLVQGSPLGVTGAGTPVLGLELRKDGEPVNPLEAMRPN